MGCVRKLRNCNFSQEEEEDGDQDEETLSLSDLLINLIDEDNISKSNKSDSDEEVEDFDFRSWSRELDMCAADDVFFQGQILPLRHHSISSESGLAKIKPENLNTSHCVSKARNPKPRIRNQFHAHPSPTPQIRVSTTPRITSCNQKYPIWEFFRLGLVRTPGIELQDLKVRIRNSSSGSSNNSICSINKKDKIRSSTGHSEQQSTKMEKQRKQGEHVFFDTERSLLSGCNCSIGSAVKPIPRNTVVIKNNARKTKEGMEKQLQELKMKKKRRKKKLTMEKKE